MKASISWPWTRSAAVGLLILGSVHAASAQALHSPKPGSAEREAIMNALRVPIDQEAQAKVTFFKVQVKSANGWAWVVAMAMDKAGKKYLLGKYSTQGLLHKGKHGWEVTHWGVSNDADVVTAAKKIAPNAPRGIFFNPPR